MAERHACEKCGGTGQVRWGKCCACNGRGSFATSPEARARRRNKHRAMASAGAQQTNRDTSVYLGVMNRENCYPLFVQMREDHNAGRCWTPAQISSARSILAGIRETRRLLGEQRFEPRASG